MSGSMLKKPRVFIVQETPRIRASSPDLLDALNYGELVVLLNVGEGEDATGVYVVNRMNAMLKDFDDDDYLLLLGNPVSLAIAAACAAAHNAGRFRCLKWDKKREAYLPVTVNLYPE